MNDRIKDLENKVEELEGQLKIYQDKEAKRNKTFLENRHTGKVSTFEKKYKLIIEEYRRQGKSIPEIMKLIGDEATLEKVKGVIYRNNIPKGK